MARYRIDVVPSAARALKKLSVDVRRRIGRAIDGLAATPRPSGAHALQVQPGLLRLRVGDYRIIYSVQDEVLLVLIVRIGLRREVYR